MWLFLLTCLWAPLLTSTQVVRTVSYGIFLDADAYATSMTVYQWPTILDDREVPIISPSSMSSAPYRIQPGFPSLVANLSLVVDQLLHFIEVAKTQIPADQHRSTPILLQGQAGMRMLSTVQTLVILSTVVNTLSNRTLSPFRFNPAWATVASGEQQASYAWAATNILLDTIYGPPQDTVAVLAMDAFSLQVAFAPTTTPTSGGFTLQYADKLIYLYAQNYMDLGPLAGYQKYLRWLASSYSSVRNRSILNPCGFMARDGSSEIIDGNTIFLNGTSNFSRCIWAVKQAHMIANGGCSSGTCAVGNIYTPPIPDSMPLVLLGMFGRFAAQVGCPPNTTVDCIFDRSMDMCNGKARDMVVQQFPTLKSLGSDLSAFCYTAALMYATLVDGFQVPRTKTLYMVDRIKGLDVSWSLGAMTKAVGSWNLNCTMAGSTSNLPPVLYLVAVDFTVPGIATQSILKWDKSVDANRVPIVATLDVLSISGDIDALRKDPSQFMNFLKNFSTRVIETVPQDTLEATLCLVSFDPSVELTPVDKSVFEEAYKRLIVLVGAVSGENHAASIWLAANSAAPTISQSSPVPTISLEQHAVTVAFVPMMAPPMAGHYPLELDGRSWQLYAHRHRGFGLDDLMDAYYMRLGAAYGNTSDPCRYNGTTFVSPAAPTYVFTGSSNFTACLKSVNSLLNLNQPCPVPNCSLGGMYQPAVPSGDVLLAGHFLHYFGFFNCTGGNAIACLQSAAPIECNKTFNNSAARYFNEDPSVCFVAAVAHQILTAAIRLTPNHITRFVSQEDSTLAKGFAITAAGQADIRPEPCYRTYANVERKGILDPAEVLTKDWIDSTADYLQVAFNATTSVQLYGLWTSHGKSLFVKVASGFQDCLGTAPGSAPDGTAFDLATKTVVVGPFAVAGDYRVCFRHDADWEPTPLILSVQEGPATDVLYFGEATCRHVLQKNPQYCGCLYRRPNWSGAQEDMYQGLQTYNHEIDVPAVLIKRVRGHVNVLQGCCQLPLKLVDEFQEGTDDYWGMCRWK